MKRKTIRLLIVSSIPCLALGLFMNGVAGKQGSSDLPGGEWSFSAAPFQGPGYKKLPVLVVSVRSDSTGGLAVTRVEIKNRSNRAIAAVKLRWLLTLDGNRNVLLREGETPFVAPSGGIPAGATRALEYPVVSFAKIAKSLLSSAGTLVGDFRLEVMVAEIQAADGTIEKNQALSEPTLVKAGFHRFEPQQDPIDGEGFGCAKQKCHYVISGGTSGYECVASTDNEFCENHESYCINRLCGTGS